MSWHAGGQLSDVISEKRNQKNFSLRLGHVFLIHVFLYDVSSLMLVAQVVCHLYLLLHACLADELDMLVITSGMSTI